MKLKGYKMPSHNSKMTFNEWNQGKEEKRVKTTLLMTQN